MNRQPSPPTVKSSRLLLTLTLAGVLAGVLIVSVYEATEPRITAYKAAVLRAAISEVLKDPDSFDTLYVVDGRLEQSLPESSDPAQFEQLYRGWRDGTVAGYGIVAAEPGFQDVIKVIFGFDRERGVLIGMRVLENKETPGLGDKIVKDSSFVAQFDGVATPIRGVKAGRSEAATEVDMITGATISSRAVIRAINEAMERFAPLIARFEEGR